MPVILGNIIAIIIVAGIVWLSVREIRKSHKSGGCGGNCAGCSGSCASCGDKHAKDSRTPAVRK